MSFLGLERNFCTMLLKNQIKDILDYLIQSEFEKRCLGLCCSSSYYKNAYLEYAIEHHTSLPCIIRTYAEMLKSGCIFTHNPNDRKHANRLISYLNVYSNSKHLEFIDSCFQNLKSAAFDHYKYLVIKISGRLKSFLSLEVKLRKKILKAEILVEFLGNLEEILRCEIWSFEEKEVEIAKLLLLEQQEKNNSKNPIRDLIGYRIIVDSYDTSIEENFLTGFIYDFADFSKAFFDSIGFDVLESKDYIKNPKGNNYQSYHFRVEILESLTEIQLRTFRMHENAESGSAAHDTVYKNTYLQNFMKKFLYEISGEKTLMNEHLGFLKEIDLPSTVWCFTPQEEIPATPAELKDFADLDFLKSVFNKNHLLLA